MAFRFNQKNLEQPIRRWVQKLFGIMLLLSAFLAIWYAVSTLWGEHRTPAWADPRWFGAVILCLAPFILVLSWRLLAGKADLGLFPPIASVTLGILILTGSVWLALHAGDVNAGPRALLGGFLAGGWSLRIGLLGLSKKRRHAR
jgi:hypothetical protein